MKSIIRLLFLANVISALIAFYLGSSSFFGDEFMYVTLAKGLAEGRFSQWYFLEGYYPDALRTFGYPVFVWAIKSIIDSNFLVRIVQLLLYFGALFLSYKILDKLTNGNKVASIIFLCLTTVNIQIPYYSGTIGAEMPCIFLSILYIYLLLQKDYRTRSAIILGILGGILFQMRPAFLVFPFVIMGFGLILDIKHYKFYFLHVVIFIISLIPYSLWNLKTHDVLKVTPLEGGSAIAYLGYWYYKLPIDYTNYGKDLKIDEVLFQHKMVSDYTNPIHFSREEREVYKNKYEEECKFIINELEPLLSKTDLKDLEGMRKSNPGGYIQYPSHYSIAKQDLLGKLLIKNIKEDPIYYVKTRIYAFCRIYFSGINTTLLKQQTSIIGKIKLLVPFFITFISIFLGLILSVIYFLKRKGKVSYGFIILLLYALYQGGSHIFFVTQARYTVPVHLCILIMVSIVIADFSKRYYKGSSVLS